MTPTPSRAATSHIPSPWDSYLIGRVLEQKLNGKARRGVVKYHTAKMGHDDPASRQRLGEAIELRFRVDWDDGATEHLLEPAVKPLATQCFMEEPWVLPVVLYLQRHNWQGAEKDLDLLKAEAAAEEKARVAAEKAAARKAAAGAGKRKGAGEEQENEEPKRKRAKTTAAAAKVKTPAKKAESGKGAAAGGGRKVVPAKAVKAQRTLKISNLEERIAAAQGAKASPGKKPLMKPAAQAAGAAAKKPATAQQPRLALDQGASNSMGVASVGEVHAAPSGSEPAASLTSPRSAAATAGPSTAAAAGRSPGKTVGAAAALKGAMRKTQATKPGGPAAAAGSGAAASRGAAQALAPGQAAAAGAARVPIATSKAAAAPTIAPVPQPHGSGSAAAGAAISPDVVDVEDKDLADVEWYTYIEVEDTPMYEYNLRKGPDGQLYRVYARDVIVPEAKCFGPRDRRCREWKVDPQDPDNELDYDVEHVVAERVNPRTKEKLWLVKWAEFELDLSDENWCGKKQLKEAKEAMREWREHGKKALERVAAHFRQDNQVA